MAYVVDTSFDQKYYRKLATDENWDALAAFNRQHNSSGMNTGIEIPPDLVPRHFRLISKRPPKNGFFSCVVGTAVDDRFVASVEGIEPGAHRFLPIEIRTTEGTLLPRPHFLMNCCTQVDAVDPARSKVKIKRHPLEPEKYPDIWYYSPIIGTFAEVTLYPDRIKGRAMWFDERLKRLIYADALMAALTAAGIDGFDLSAHIAEA